MSGEEWGRTDADAGIRSVGEATLQGCITLARQAGAARADSPAHGITPISGWMARCAACAPIIPEPFSHVGKPKAARESMKVDEQ